jgi:V/A-type H+/Na+-transporting ATPase subunit E
MSLDRLLDEIRAQGAQELAAAEEKSSSEKLRIVNDRDHRVKQLRADLESQGANEARRQHGQKIAGARMQARKLEYEAREAALERSLGSVQDMLKEYTRSNEYPDVLARMYALAVNELGKDLRVMGRAEDASTLKDLAGRGFVAQPQAILGGLIAETPEGDRRLTLTFDELLRYREDRLRELLA